MDFDGTLSQKDVGEQIFNKFGDEKQVIKIIDKEYSYYFCKVTTSNYNLI